MAVCISAVYTVFCTEQGARHYSSGCMSGLRRTLLCEGKTLLLDSSISKGIVAWDEGQKNSMYKLFTDIIYIIL